MSEDVRVLHEPAPSATESATGSARGVDALARIRTSLDDLVGSQNTLDVPAAGVRVHSARAPSTPVSVLFEPMLYLVFQGAKRLVVGGQEVVYGANRIVTMVVDLPAVVEVTEATDRSPYLSIEMPIERAVLSELLAQMPPRRDPVIEPIAVHPMPAAVVEAASRLADLMSSPDDARVLAADARREVLYRVLQAPAGDSLRGLAVEDSTLAAIGRATRWMQQHLDVAVTVDDLAAMSSMSLTSFHRRFKQATGTSPLSYLKTIRLHEARRRLATNGASVASVAESVGYVSPSQFSREYKRAFGSPPSRDVVRLQVGPGPWVR